MQRTDTWIPVRVWNLNLCVWQHSHYDDQAMGWITEELWFHFRGTRFTLLQCPDWLWVPTSCLFQWALLAISLRVKWPGSEIGHSPPSRGEIKNKWRYSSIHTYAFMSCTGTNLRNYVTHSWSNQQQMSTYQKMMMHICSHSFKMSNAQCITSKCSITVLHLERKFDSVTFWHRHTIS